MPDGTEKLFYVRSRGRVTGPLNLTALMKLVRRGGISGVDELSENQIEWTRASEYEELFPRPSAAASARAPRADVRDQGAEHYKSDAPKPGEQPERAPEQAEAEEPSRSAGTGTLYKYAQRGVVVGPVTEAVLRSLAENGTLHRDDAVWADGSPQSVEARHLVFLATAFRGPTESMEDAVRRQERHGAGAAVSREERERALKQSNRRVSIYVLVAAIVWVAIAMLCLHLPLGVVDSKVTGWWTFAKSSEFPTAAMVTTLIVTWHVLVCMGIVLIASLTRGKARAIGLIILGSAAAIPVLSVAAYGLTSGWTLFLVSMLFIIPIATSGLASLLRVRRTAGAGESAPGWLGVFAAVAGLSSLFVLITTIAVLFNLPEPVRIAGVVGVVVGIVLIFISIGAIIAGSILGLVALKPKFSPIAHLVGAICARTGLALLVAGTFITCFDMGQIALWMSDALRGTQVTGESLAWAILLGRMTLLCLFAPAIVALGLEELANELVVTRGLNREFPAEPRPSKGAPRNVMWATGSASAVALAIAMTWIVLGSRPIPTSTSTLSPGDTTMPPTISSPFPVPPPATSIAIQPITVSTSPPSPIPTVTPGKGVVKNIDDPAAKEATGFIVFGLQLVRADGATAVYPVLQGSGFAISPRGYILTNKHVITPNEEFDQITNEAASKKTASKPRIWAIFSGHEFDADLVYISKTQDWAVLRIAPDSVPYFRLSAVPSTAATDDVFAIGYPEYARLASSDGEAFRRYLRASTLHEHISQYFESSDFVASTSKGVVSREFPAEDGVERVLWIDHTAQIGHGNSGGPLLSRSGVVLGINTGGAQDERGTILRALQIAQFHAEMSRIVLDAEWK